MNKTQKIVILFFSLFFSNIVFSEPNVFKYVLKNGLTLLVRPVKTSEKVSMQIWYNVGSKDERTSEKGLAHLIEHMIFKGTEKLSETDIPLITHKLSGYCNAATSFDSTHYLFNIPRHNWKQLIPVMADCMSNCTFKEDLLSSELKAVVQELKMYKDRYGNQLLEKMISTIFPDHPYHNPIIGYKQDLWSLSRDSLMQFYKKHYVPNNATLVVVGDVDPKEVFEEAQKYFGPIKPDFTYEKSEFYLNKDLEAKTVTIYRDVHQSQVMLAFVIPGAQAQKDFEFELIHMVLTGGKESRLNKLLVDELKLVNWVSSSNLDLCEYDLFFIQFEPKNNEDIDALIKHISNQLILLKKEGITQEELLRACKNTKSEFYHLMESNFQQANAIGKTFLQTNNEEYIFLESEHNYELCNKSITALAEEYLRPTIMHKGFIFPLPESEKKHWLSLQERSDQEDVRILSGRIRESALEEGKYVESIKLSTLKEREFPKPTSHTLSNGLEVFSFHNPNVPKISLILEMKADLAYEPDDLRGLYHVLNYMLEEGGTQNYTAEQFAKEIESRGISWNIGNGTLSMSMLTEDFGKGLELLYELVAKAAFDKKALLKVKEWALADYHRSINNPGFIERKLIRESLYKNHPYAKCALGDEESINNINRKDIVNFYNNYFSPDGAKLSIVGDFGDCDIHKVLENTLGSWQGAKIADIEYPSFSSVEHKTITHYMNRDQIYLSFAGHSIDRNHEDFDKLLIFDEIFGHGMHSILFQLREESGAFYTINGSLLSGSGKQPGLVLISTIVSQDRLQEVKNLLSKKINEVADSITQQQVDEARTMILHTYDDLYAKNHSIASTFLFLDRYNLPVNYFEKRHETLSSIMIDDVKQAVKKYLNLDKMMIFQVGRLE